MWGRMSVLLDNLISLLKQQQHDDMGDPALGMIWERSVV